MRTVIVHPDMGIFIGHSMGFAFFSMLDCAGQTGVATFDDPADARTHVSTWEAPFNNTESFAYVRLKTAGKWASIEELDAAGLERFTGRLKEERLLIMPPAGNA